MVKIKRKAQKTLPQLIEWAWENDIRNRQFVCNEHEAKSVVFNLNGWAEFSGEFSYNPNDTFTFEVEEEITEDTEFNELVGLDVDGGYWQYDNVCVYDFNLDRIKAIYIPNDDLTMTLIWRDGRLIE